MMFCVWTWFSWLPLWFVTCYFTLVVFVPFHFISSGFQLFSTATLLHFVLWFVMIWVGTWRHNFIMDYEIMKLDVVHWSLNWCSWLQFDLIHLIYLIWACSPSLYLIWVAIVLDCNFIQLDIIVLLLFELTRGGIISLWIMNFWSCKWVIKKWLKEDLIHLSIYRGERVGI